MSDLREEIQWLVEAAYLHGLPVENLGTGELEPPADISDVTWITDRIVALLERATVEALDSIGEPKMSDFDIKPDSYDDVLKAIRWYKNRLATLKAGTPGQEGAK